LRAIASELGEDPDDLYFAYVKGKMPLFVEDASKGLQSLWDCFKQYLKDDLTIKSFLASELNLEKLKAYRDYRVRELNERWRRRLSDGARHLLHRLEGEFGEQIELPIQEVIDAGKLLRVEFLKREDEIWLPMLRRRLQRHLAAPQKAKKLEKRLKKGEKKISKSERSGIYNDYALFYERQRLEYGNRLGTGYGADKAALLATQKEIWEKRQVNVTLKALKEAIGRRVDRRQMKKGKE